MPTQSHPDSFKSLSTLTSGSTTCHYFRLKALEQAGVDLTRLPFSLRILLENLLRNEDGRTVTGGGYQVSGFVGPEGRAFARDCLHAGAGADAGLYRRAWRLSIWRRCAMR